MPSSLAERQKKSRAAAKQAGGKVVTVRLSASAVKALNRAIKQGLSQTEAINSAIIFWAGK